MFRHSSNEKKYGIKKIAGEALHKSQRIKTIFWEKMLYEK